MHIFYLIITMINLFPPPLFNIKKTAKTGPNLTNPHLY